jgi:hypothetical protein
MDSQPRIARDTFFVFDPDRELTDVLARVRSPKIAQVLRYWDGLRKDRELPARADIDPAEIKAALPYLMITGISYEPLRVLYRLVGTEIVRWARIDFTNRYADELIFDEEGRDWTDYYRAVIDARKPAYGMIDWVEQDRAPLWAESLFCPLSSDGRIIDRCIAIEDYQPMSVMEIEALPPVGQRQSRASERASAAITASPQ